MSCEKHCGGEERRTRPQGKVAFRADPAPRGAPQDPACAGRPSADPSGHTPCPVPTSQLPCRTRLLASQPGLSHPEASAERVEGFGPGASWALRLLSTCPVAQTPRVGGHYTVRPQRLSTPQQGWGVLAGLSNPSTPREPSCTFSVTTRVFSKINISSSFSCWSKMKRKCGQRVGSRSPQPLESVPRKPRGRGRTERQSRGSRHSAPAPWGVPSEGARVREALTAVGSRVRHLDSGVRGPPLPSTRLQPGFAAPSAPSASAFLEAPPPPGRGVRQLCLVVCVSWQHMSPVFL